jgi:pimeloyl-ACP methyl ester carboxylesterase
LVGHSHGAMIGYVLATQHPDEITRLDLFCPVARPRFIPRMAIHGVHLLRRLGVPAPLIVRFFAHPLLVSLVTRYSFRREWSHKIRQQIVRMRQRESRYYSPVLFDMMEQTLRFMRDMGDSFAAVPTNIYHVTDDNVAGDNDYRWYQRHANTQTVQAMTGGHLCVVADPARVVALLNERDN